MMRVTHRIEWGLLHRHQAFQWVVRVGLDSDELYDIADYSRDSVMNLIDGAMDIRNNRISELEENPTRNDHFIITRLKNQVIELEELKIELDRCPRNQPPE